MDNEMLEHHGIKGMKWGVRRFQTATGALTAAGKSRYEKRAEKLKARNALLDQKLKAKAKYQQLKDENAAKKALLKGKKKDDDTDDAKKADEKGAPKKKGLSQMTDAEIDRAVERAKLETSYLEYFPEKQTLGQKFVDTIKNDIVKPWAVDTGKSYLTKLAETVGEKYLGIKIDPDKDLSWSDKIKKQTWTQNEKNKELEDLQREKSIRDAKKALGGDADSTDKSSTSTDKSSTSTTKKATYETPEASVSGATKKATYTEPTAGIYEPGSSKTSGTSTKSETSKNTYYTDSFRDVTGSSASSAKSASKSDVKSLVPTSTWDAPVPTTYSGTSSSTTSIIAGLLEDR